MDPKYANETHVFTKIADPAASSASEARKRALWEAMSAAAASNGHEFYRDPETGYMVATRESLTARGDCCGNGCRHCPY